MVNIKKSFKKHKEEWRITPTAPYAILQADPTGNTSEESASLNAMENDAETNFLPLRFTEILPHFFPLKTVMAGNSLVVPWSRLHTSTAGGTGSIPG